MQDKSKKIKDKSKKIKDKSKRGFLSFIFYPLSSEGGFTLIELTVALGIFASLVVGVVGVTIQLMSAQQKAAAIQAVMDNLRFNTELMTREMRTGLDFNSGDPPPLNCAGSIPGTEIRFKSFNQGPVQYRVYYLADLDGDGAGDTIMRIATPDIAVLPSCAAAEAFTSGELVVSDFRYSIRGAAPYPSDGQPFITLNINVRSKDTKILADTKAALQATVTQRVRDL